MSDAHQEMRSSKKQFQQSETIPVKVQPEKKKSQSPGREQKLSRMKTNSNAPGSQSLVTLPKITSTLNFGDTQSKYLPSRFSAQEKVKQITFHPKQVLEDLQVKIEEVQSRFPETQDPKQIALKTQQTTNIQPSAFRITQPHQFQKRPLCRKDNDFLMFKEIFVAPSEKKLTELKVQQQQFDDLFHQGTQVQYDKILNIYDEEKEQKNMGMRKLDDDLQNTIHRENGFNSSLKEEFKLKQTQTVKLSPRKEVEKLLKENMALLEQNFELDQTHPPQTYFFDQQIQIQAPDLPNATIASPLTPGNGYAPSLPLTHNFKDSKSSIKDLLVRAKAGMQAGDIQQQAHLSFYLGMVYESNKSFQQAVQFYNQFFTCARMMEDKIGMALGSNRIAINYFNLGKYEQSIEHHKQNIQLSDIENTFAGYFNIGICYRKNKQFSEAVLNFNKALEWARQRDEIESQCLAYGQLGVTYYELGSYQKSTDKFSTCYELAKQLRNTQLQLDCLMHITKITGYTSLKSSEDTIQVLHDAIECARILDDKQTSAICISNLGVLQGTKHYQQMIRDYNFEPEIEDDYDYDENEGDKGKLRSIVLDGQNDFE